MIFASAQRTVGILIAVVVAIGFAVYVYANIRRARAEVGSEIELAPNRKPYFSDEELEGKKLDRTLTWGLIGLTVVGVALPLYWLREPGRQAGAVENFQSTFVSRGEELFAPTAEGGLNCAGCHGPEGVGGVAAHTLTDAEGNFLKQVQWRAPALDTVLLRYSRDEVRYVLTYGRPFSPMPAWGIEGGGPLNEQQIENLIDYMASIQLSPEEARAQATEELEKAMATGRYDSEGEALFNLGLESGFAGGAYACGRCHTQGWSYGEPQVPGGGAMGPNLTGLAAELQFPDPRTQVEFVTEGSEDGVEYGRHGQGRGRMPGFGRMLTQEQIKAIVEYERSL